MAKVDTGVRHAHDIHGRLKSLAYVTQDLTDVTWASTPAGQSTVCDKITDGTVVDAYGTCGGVGLSIAEHFGGAGNYLQFAVTLEPLYSSDPAAFLRLRVNAVLPGYSPDLPAGAIWSGSVGGEFYLDTTGDDFDVSLQFTTYLYYFGAGLYRFEVEDDPAPQLLIGPLAVTFTRQPDPVSPNGRNIAGTYDAYRRIWCGYDVNHILKYALDTALVTLPLTDQPQIAGPDPAYRTPYYLDYTITALDAELVRQEGPTWDIVESGPLIAGSILAGHDYAFPVWADPVYDAPTTEDVSTVCHATFDPTFSRWNQSCTNTTLSHSQTLGVKFAHYAAIEKFGEPTNKKNIAPAETFVTPAISCLTLCDPGPAPGGGLSSKSPAQLACLTLENTPNGRYAFDLAYSPERALARQNIFPPSYEWIVEGGGVDLVEASNGWLFRTYRNVATVYVDRSRDGGATWDPPVVVGASGGAAADAAPSITIDARDTLFVWFQASDLYGNGYYSESWGAYPWTLYATHPAMWYPRLVILPDRQLLAYFNGTQLAVDQSQDWGDTLTTAATFGTPPRRPFVFKADRFGIPHLVYEDAGGALLHRYSEDPMRFGSWADTATLAAAGSFPGWGMGIHDGFVVWFVGSTPHVARLTETGGAVEVTVEPLAGALDVVAPGVIVTRNDYAYIAGRAGGGLANQYSPDAGLHWTALP